VDIDSFSDAAPEVRKETVLVIAAEAPAAVETIASVEAPAAAKAPAADVSLPTRSRDEASPEFTKELELTVQRGKDPVERAPLLEVREVVPEDQAPSPSLAAFNKSFGTSHRGELLSVGFKTTSIGSQTSKILTLWKSHVLVDETGGEGSEQPGGVARDSE
jgi:predicted alpha/beta hydrolase